MTGKRSKQSQKQGAKSPTLHMQYGHRVIFKAMGYTSEELSLPRIAVVNSWSEQSPGHSHLRAISEKEMEKRKSKWTPPDQSHITGTLLMYATSALQADQGAGWPVRWSDLAGR